VKRLALRHAASNREDNMSEGNATTDTRFLGSWKLVGVNREEVATGKKLDTDMQQSGYISYTPDGRMMVMIARHRADTEDEITAYAGKWHVEGECVIHDVDMAVRAPWKNTRQVRGFRFHGNRLTLSPPVSEDYIHGSVTRRSLEWEKM